MKSARWAPFVVVSVLTVAAAALAVNPPGPPSVQAANGSSSVSHASVVDDVPVDPDRIGDARDELLPVIDSGEDLNLNGIVEAEWPVGPGASLASVVVAVGNFVAYELPGDPQDVDPATTHVGQSTFLAYDRTNDVVLDWAPTFRHSNGATVEVKVVEAGSDGVWVGGKFDYVDDGDGDLTNEVHTGPLAFLGYDGTIDVGKWELWSSTHPTLNKSWATVNDVAYDPVMSRVYVVGDFSNENAAGDATLRDAAAFHVGGPNSGSIDSSFDIRLLVGNLATHDNPMETGEVNWPGPTPEDPTDDVVLGTPAFGRQVDVSSDGRHVVMAGNFSRAQDMNATGTAAGKKTRLQIVVVQVDLLTGDASLTPFQSGKLAVYCRGRMTDTFEYAPLVSQESPVDGIDVPGGRHFIVRGLDIDPLQDAFYVTTTGGPHVGNYHEDLVDSDGNGYLDENDAHDLDWNGDPEVYSGDKLCSGVAKFSFTSGSPIWSYRTGGDTITAVVATGAAVYVSGHFTSLGNSDGVEIKQAWLDDDDVSGLSCPGITGDAGSTASISGNGDKRVLKCTSSAAFVQGGLAAIEEVNGSPQFVVDFTPDVTPVKGAEAFYPTADGLWMASDVRYNGKRTGLAAFFPLPTG